MPSSRVNSSGSDPVELFIYLLAELGTAADAGGFEERVGSTSTFLTLESTVLQAQANQFSHAEASPESLLAKPFVQFIRQENCDAFHVFQLHVRSWDRSLSHSSVGSK